MRSTTEAPKKVETPELFNAKIDRALKKFNKENERAIAEEYHFRQDDDAWKKSASALIKVLNKALADE